MTSDELLRYRIALNLVPGIGDVLIRNLVSYCGSEEAVFKEKYSKLQKIPGIGEILAKNIFSFKNFERAEKEIEFIKKHQIRPIFYLDKEYPQRLHDCLDAPNMLFSLGNTDLNLTRIVAVVGTRNASEYGRQFTQQLLEALKSKGVLIVSGLAMGIDAMAHRYALENELLTVGVLAHGLDRLYPPQNKSLAKKMLDQGALLTEYISGTNPDRENFPKRNRIVAGMCDALVLVETAIKGGARITAEIAHSYNKDVFCVPGRINDYYSQGCNYLIQANKAAMLCTPEDLIETMHWGEKKNKNQSVSKQALLFNQLMEEDQLLLTYIRSKVKVGLDKMAFELQLDPGNLALKLLELEFNGLLRSLPGKVYEMA